MAEDRPAFTKGKTWAERQARQLKDQEAGVETAKPTRLVAASCRLTQEEFDRLLAASDATEIEYSFIMRHFILQGLARYEAGEQLPTDLGPIRRRKRIRTRSTP